MLKEIPISLCLPTDSRPSKWTFTLYYSPNTGTSIVRRLVIHKYLLCLSFSFHIVFCSRKSRLMLVQGSPSNPGSKRQASYPHYRLHRVREELHFGSKKVDNRTDSPQSHSSNVVFRRPERDPTAPSRSGAPSLVTIVRVRWGG